MNPRILSKELIDFFCTAGSFAPSGGNIQPWKVDAYSDYIDISLDPQKSNSILDYQTYASVFSIGSFVENMCIAIEQKKIDNNIEIIENKPFRVRIILNREQKVKIQKPNLYKYIFKRMTSRTMSNGEEISHADITQLTDVFKNKSSVAKVYLVSKEEQKKVIANLLGKTDVIRTLHKELFIQMISELRFDKESIEKTRDGIDINTLELPGNAAQMLKLMARQPNIRYIIPKKAFEDMAKPLIRSVSHIGCLSLRAPLTFASIFESGRLMQHFWLVATSMDIHIHPWTVQTFFSLRANDVNDEVFNNEEKKEILIIQKKLIEVFDIEPSFIPFFIYRMYKGEKSLNKSLRIPWESFTTIH